MLDINEKVGKAACSNLQKEFTHDDVMFVATDVTKKDQLVRIVLDHRSHVFLW